MNKDSVIQTVKNLQINNFETFIVDSVEDARALFIETILKPEIGSVSYGDSETLLSTGIVDYLKKRKDINFIDTFSENCEWKELIRRRKEALTVDLFLMGTNAITEKGQLINLDMVGNRVAPLAFGPRKIVVFVGINKIVADIESGMKRIKSISAPQNAIRHPALKTPCQSNGICYDCKSPERLCNTWNITEKSYPKGRIKVVIIKQELGI